jgi:hypothetical protein
LLAGEDGYKQMAKFVIQQDITGTGKRIDYSNTCASGIA